MLYFSYSTKLYKIQFLYQFKFNWISIFLPSQLIITILQDQYEVGVQIPYAFAKLKHTNCCFLSSPACPLYDWFAHMEYGKRSSVNTFLELLVNRESNWAACPLNLVDHQEMEGHDNKKESLPVAPVSSTKNLLPDKQLNFLVSISAKRLSVQYSWVAD